MKSGVYLLTNTWTGRQYVGCSKFIPSRLASHRQAMQRNRTNRRMQEDLRKYGPESFHCEVILWCGLAARHFYEQLFIDKLRPYYNIVGSPAYREERDLIISQERLASAKLPKPKPVWGKQHTVRGVTGTLRQLCQHFEISPVVVRARISVAGGWDLEEALTTPAGQRRNPSATHTVRDVTGTVAELARHFGVDYGTVRWRLGKKWPLERALTTPPADVGPKVFFTIDGIRGTCGEHCRRLGLAQKTVERRLQRGWEPERAFAKSC